MSGNKRNNNRELNEQMRYQERISPRRGKASPEYEMLDDADLEEIPVNLRQSIQKIINKRVGQRIAEEVAALREEIKADIAD